MAQDISADVVVVGAGIAGGLVALQLAQANKSVALLEAGPRLEHWQVVERYRNTANKDDFMAPYPPAPYAPHPQYSNVTQPNYLIQNGPQPYNCGYIRAVGGTTWHWAAAAWRYLPNDFKLRSLYGVGRDWPITYDVLEPYYYRAEVELGVSGPTNQDLGSPRANPFPMPGIPQSWMDQRATARLGPGGYTVVTEPMARNSRPYDSRPSCCGNNTCMPCCPIKAMYMGPFAVTKAEKAGAHLQPSSVAYQLEVDPTSHKITAVNFKDPSGASHRATGRVFVLAANGIETPKLMLMSTSASFPNGVANTSDMVGRNLMDHPGTGVNFLADEPVWQGRGPVEITCINNLRDGAFRARYAASKINLVNIQPARMVTTDLIKQGVYGAALDPQIRDHTSRMMWIRCFLEQVADPTNRVVPSAQFKDAIGIPRPAITYSIDNYTRNGAAQVRQHYAHIAQLMGGSSIQFLDDFANNNHILGTTIMGSDPKNSVVGPDCRSWDHHNLFVASSSVFPTTATVNPTLTIVALAMRMADQIKTEV
jgi:glucose dehydrogenase